MRRAIGIDLGGTQIRAALIDEEGTILSRAVRTTPAKSGAAAVVDVIRDAAAEAAGDLGFDGVDGIGVASPGPLDTIRGVTLGLPTISGFDNVPLRAMLGDAFGRDVVLENDGIAAAIGEWRFGAGQGLSDFIYITVSTGIGGGVVAGGQILRGQKGMAGHVGHLTLYPDGIRCGCGNLGCWESYAAGPAFEARANLAEGRTFGADAPSVFAAARAGDRVASALVDVEARYLGLGLVSLLHLFNPQQIIMGGGICHHFDLLLPGIVSQVQQLAMPAFRDTVIVRAQHFGNSGLLGAAGLIFSGA